MVSFHLAFITVNSVGHALGHWNGASLFQLTSLALSFLLLPGYCEREETGNA